MNNELNCSLLSTFDSFSQSINKLITWKDNDNATIKNIQENNDGFNKNFNNPNQPQVLPIYNNNIEINHSKKGKKEKVK